MDKSYLKLGISFLAGGVVGSAITWVITKTYYKKIADKEIEETKNWYQKKLEETEISPEEFEEATGMTSDELTEKRRLAKKNRNKPDIVDYTTFYNTDGKKRPSVETSLAEMEHPKDSDEDEEPEGTLVEDEFSEPDAEADDHSEENRRAGELMMAEDKADEGRDPYTIEEAMFYSDSNRNGQETLFYYTENDCLVNEHDEIVENRELIIGNTLEEPDWDESGVMYVRNPRLKCDYEVTRVEAEFQLD